MYVKQNNISIVGFCERFPLPPNYADSAACWSVDQVALSLWLAAQLLSEHNKLTYLLLNRLLHTSVYALDIFK